jgi:hypothetical protein
MPLHSADTYLATPHTHTMVMVRAHSLSQSQEVCNSMLLVGQLASWLKKHYFTLLYVVHNILFKVLYNCLYTPENLQP